MTLHGQNSIELVNPPITVPVNDTETINLSYTNNSGGNAYVLARFKKGSENLGQAFVEVVTGSSTVSLNVPTPTETGGGYSLQAQLLRKSDWGGLANAVVPNVTVGGDVPPLGGQSSVTFVDAPTTVPVNDSEIINLSYTNNSGGNAYVLARFKKGSENLGQAFVEVGTGSSTVSLNVPTPTETGGGYSLQAQLLRKSDWGGLANAKVDNVTVGGGTPPPSGENTLEIINTSRDPINNGDTRRVNIRYNLTQSARILVEVRDNEVPVGSKKIGQVWKDVESGQNTIGFDLVVNNGNPKESNRVQAFLFEPNSWVPIQMPSSPYIIVGKGDGTITYRGQPYENDNTQNLKFEEDLGKGYFTNWFVNNEWKGPLKAKFGLAQQTSWVDWNNNGHSGFSHAEFDIKIQKYSWHEYKDPSVFQGYPTQISDISGSLNCHFRGQWSPKSEGRTFINMTAWIYSGGGDLDQNNYEKSDIIIHAWDNSGDMAKKYADNPNDNLEVLGSITSGEVTYHTLKRDGGGFGEVATYNLVPKNGPRVGIWNEGTFATNEFEVNINVQDILNQLIEKDGNSATPDISNNWWLHGLEWTFTGSSADTIGGAYVKDSKGRFTFLNYSIPDIRQQSNLKAQIDVKDSVLVDGELNALNVFPNPFTNSFVYEYSVEKEEPITVELYTLNGKKVRTIKKTMQHDIGNYNETIDTSDLGPGIYIIRITSSSGYEAKKLVKN